MKSIAVILGILVSGTLGLAQAKEDPQPVHFIREGGYQGAEFYRTQAALWEKEAGKPGAAATAWFNYYLASDYAGIGSDKTAAEKHNHLQKILQQLAQRYPGSYEYWLLRGRLDHADSEATWNAHVLKPEAPEPYYTLLRHAALKGQAEEFNTYCRELYATATMHPGFLDYNYNVLQSTEPDAILITHGDNDTYPAWLLQSVHRVRQDVLVINLHLALGYPDYLQRILKARRIATDSLANISDRAAFLQALCRRLEQAGEAVYVAATMDPALLKEIKPRLYLSGLALRYSSSRFNNLPATDRAWRTLFRKDALTYSWNSESHVSQPLVKQLNMNYLPVLLTLYEEARSKALDSQADDLLMLARYIAEAADKAGEVDSYLDQKR